MIRRSGESRSFAWFGRLFDAVTRGPRGELELARARVREGKQIATELGLPVNAACTSLQLAHAELLGGELLEAEGELRAAVPVLEGFGALNPLASVAAPSSAYTRDTCHSPRTTFFAAPAIPQW